MLAFTKVTKLSEVEMLFPTGGAAVDYDMCST